MSATAWQRSVLRRCVVTRLVPPRAGVMFSRTVAALTAPRPSRGLLLLSCCGLSFAHRLGQSVRRPPTPRLAAVFSSLSTNPSFDLSLPCRNLAFYLIGEVAEPDEAVRRHRKFLDESSMVGRVYICSSGVNAQVSGTAAACSAYRRFVTAEFPEDPPLFKEDPVAEPTFPKLRVKHKALVPAVDAAVDLTQRGEALEPNPDPNPNPDPSPHRDPSPSSKPDQARTWSPRRGLRCSPTRRGPDP